MNDSYRTILRVKTYRFAYAMVCWSIGTLAFSILLIIYEIAPPFIGWIGVVATIPVGIGNGIKISKKNNPLTTNLITIGGLLAIIFEILIGVGLLFYAFS